MLIPLHAHWPNGDITECYVSEDNSIICYDAVNDKYYTLFQTEGEARESGCRLVYSGGENMRVEHASVKQAATRGNSERRVL